MPPPSKVVLVLDRGDVLRRRSVPWGPIDQILSSVTNSLILIVAARRLAPEALGSFAIAMSVAMIVVGLARALTSQPLTIAYAARSATELRSATRRAVAGSVAVGAVVGAVVAIVGAAVGGAVGSGLVVVAVGLPVLLTQDTLRLAFFASSPSWGATLSDGLWLVFVGAGVVAYSSASSDILLLIWIAGAAAGAVISSIQLRLWRANRVSSAANPGWFAQHWDLSSGLLADGALVAASGQAMPIILGLVASVEASGSYRVAQTAIGPMMTVLGGASIQLLPSLARERTPAVRRSMAARFSMRFMCGALTYAGVLLLAPTDLVDRLFGGAWPDARSTAIVLGVSAAGTALVQGPLLMLRAGAETTRIARLRLWLAPLQLIVTCVLAGMLGSVGAAVGLAIMNWAAAPLWWQMVRSTPDGEARRTQVTNLNQR